jgi:hypothetical protein
MPKNNYAYAISFLVFCALTVQPSSGITFELFPRPAEQYTIQRDDNLFGIAGKYYSNSALWPFLWRQNPWIALDGRTGQPEKQPLSAGARVNLYNTRKSHEVFNETYSPPSGLPDDLGFFARKFPESGIPYDKSYFRFRLSQRPALIWGYVISSPEVNKLHFVERDLVYIRFRPSKSQVVLVGDRFGVFRDHGPISHPLNPNTEIGYLSEVVGEVEITSTGNDLVTGIILESYSEIRKGDKISLFAPKPREIVPSKSHLMKTGTILVSATRQTWYNESNNLENDIVFIDRGECDGIREGLLLSIYRPNDRVPDPYFQRSVSPPDTFVGEGMVLKAFDKNSTVLITRTREEVVPGYIVKSVSD